MAAVAREAPMSAMNQNEVRIVLQRASDDPAVNAPEFQKELGGVSKSLHSANVKYTVRGMTFDSVDALGFQLPEFVVTLAPGAIGAVAGICGAWVQARYGRKVRLKIGDVEAEGRSVDEIASLLKRAADFRKFDSTKSDNT
jgi:hypothetical protein